MDIIQNQYQQDITHTIKAEDTLLLLEPNGDIKTLAKMLNQLLLKNTKN